jgi:RecB family exonuclease
MALAVVAHPSPLVHATARQRLSVTLAAQDPSKICPLSLSQEASRERQFPPVASAVIGTLVHAIIEDATRRGEIVVPDAAASLSERCNSWDGAEDGGLRWPQLVPLRRYLVDERRRDALATIAAGLAHISRSGVRPTGGGSSGGAPPPLDPGVAGRWPERTIEDGELGLRGCIDLLICDGRGALLVIDYKTGFDQEAEDQQDKRAVYHRQVQIYLLMLSRMHPRATLSGRLIGSHGEDEVPWSDSIARATSEHLDRVRAALVAIGTTLAVPAESTCMFCPVRHRCPTFRPWVESMRTTAGSGFLAGNVWGNVQQPPRVAGHQASMTLRDASGAAIVLNGLVPREGYEALAQGAPVSAYGLKPERDMEGKIKSARLWERRATGRSLCASALLFAGHPASS